LAPLPVAIHTPDDPAIAEFSGIRERDLTRDRGQFIAEGTVVLSMLAKAHVSGDSFRMKKLLLLENRVQGLADQVNALPDDVAVYVASADVIDKIAGFHLHRGVLALGERLDPPLLTDALAALPQKALVVLTIGLSNHDNIGAIFRNAAAFGADLVLLDQTCCDPLYRKAIRVSVGSVLTVPWLRTGTPENHLEKLKQHGFALWGLSPDGTHDMRDIPATDRIALVVGAEGPGLPKHVLDSITTARISQKRTLDSLNVATATGIALHHVGNLMKKTETVQFNTHRHATRHPQRVPPG
jgi:tRNA G18 (ribose-2'-O)-methylase SpoU